MNEKAWNKWLYTKPVLVAVSSKFKYMLNLSPKEKSHHDTGISKVMHDHAFIQDALEEITTKYINPFDTVSTSLTIIATGEHASDKVCSDLTHIKDIGAKALQTCIEGKSKSMTVVKLNTFESQRAKLGNTLTFMGDCKWTQCRY